MQYDKIRLGIIGSGKWGINHIKTAYALLKENLVCVCDTNETTGGVLNNLGIGAKFSTDIKSICSDAGINAVIISTPAETHYELAKKCLESGKNVLVEKPITLKTDEARELYGIAKAVNLKLMVGHVLLYHPAILKIKKLIDEGDIGKLQYIYSNRLNLGTIRTEENILWSFAPHDISVIQYLTGSYPEKINAFGAGFLQKSIEDTTITILEYPGNVHAHIFVSWLHPFKEQRLIVIGSEGMLVFEDTLAQDKLKFYKKGFKSKDGSLEKFDAEFENIEYENNQPLMEEQKHFFDCIVNDKTPLTDGKSALDVLRILETATERLLSVK
jgi:UDP-2-acetamido-3-amino-2,3-dideoxy-glucuronate N-acetyltransferase